jgi:dienelactone hydrolase
MFTLLPTIIHNRYSTLFISFLLCLTILGNSAPGFAASSGKWVTFHMATTPPSPFKIRQAAKKGIELKAEPGTKIGGQLYLPESGSPVPAVVFIHGCLGVRNFQKQWADRLNSWGYAALVVDSFTPRGVDAGKVCDNLQLWDFHEEIAGRPFDVYGALEYLTTHPKIDGDKLAVIGWDRATAMTNVAEIGIREMFDVKLKGAIAMSPDCRQVIEGNVIAPLLILTGGKNDWWPSDKCKVLQQNSKSTGLAPVTLKIYDNAFHSFDDPETGKKLYLANAFNHFKMPTKGATLGYDPNAHEDSVNQVRGFLKSIFK